jgi:hypothetical protein
VSHCLGKHGGLPPLNLEILEWVDQVIYPIYPVSFYEIFEQAFHHLRLGEKFLVKGIVFGATHQANLE